MPYVSCTGPDRQELLALGIVGLLLWAIGIPVLFASLMARTWSKRESPEVYTVVGFFYGCYKKQYHWCVRFVVGGLSVQWT